VFAELLQGPQERFGGDVLEPKDDRAWPVVGRRRAVGGGKASGGLDAMALEGLAALALDGLLAPAFVGEAAVVFGFLASEGLTAGVLGPVAGLSLVGVAAGGLGPGAPCGAPLVGLAGLLFVECAWLRACQGGDPQDRHHHGQAGRQTPSK
jgi:hypothetical protein